MLYNECKQMGRLDVEDVVACTRTGQVSLAQSVM